MNRRDPAIHVRLSDLQKIFSKMKVDIDLNKFLRESQPYAIRDRSIIKTTRVTKKKLDRIKEFDRVNVNQFQNKLINIRTQAGHRNITPIRETDTTYSLLKEVTANAVEFCKAYTLGLEIGFGIYIKMVLEAAGKRFRFNSLKTYKQFVFDVYESRLIIKEDQFAEDTEDFYNIYLEVMESEGVEDLELTESEYVNMVIGREQADRLKADYKDYITAQFKGLESLTSVPSLGAFHGANAEKRYRIYIKSEKKTNYKLEKTAYDSV